MTRFPTAGHLVSWAGLCPRTIQSGTRTRPGRNPGTPTCAATSARPPPEPPARPPSSASGTPASPAAAAPPKPRSPPPASIVVIIWHLLADRDARYHDLGPDYYETHTDKNRKTRNHVRQLEALGYTVTLTHSRLTSTSPHHRRASQAGSAGAAARPAKVVYFPVSDAA